MRFVLKLKILYHIKYAKVKRFYKIIAKNNFITSAPGITGHQFVNVSNPTNNYINVGAYVEAEQGYRSLNFVHGQTSGGASAGEDLEFGVPGIFGSYNTVLGQLKHDKTDFCKMKAHTHKE